MTYEEEVRLISLAQKGDRDAYTEIYNAQYRFLWWVCKRIYTKDDIFDRFQDACLGLIHCISRFDLTRGIRLTTFLRKSLPNYLRRKEDIGSLIRVPHSSAANWRRSGYSRYEFEACKVYEGIRSLDLVRPSTSDKYSKSRPLIDTILDEYWESELSSNRENLVLMQEAITKLQLKDRIVIEARLNGWSLKEIGEQLGVSRERVRQIEERAILTLRKIIKVDPSELGGKVRCSISNRSKKSRVKASEDKQPELIST